MGLYIDKIKALRSFTRDTRHPKTDDVAGAEEWVTVETTSRKAVPRKVAPRATSFYFSVTSSG